MGMTSLPCYIPTAGTSTAIQDALDSAAAANGGTVFLPAGTYWLEAPLVISGEVDGADDIAVHLMGDGPGATVLLAAQGVDCDLVRVHASYARIAGLSADGGDQPTHAGIVVGSLLPASPIRRVSVDRCVVTNPGFASVHFPAGSLCSHDTEECLVELCSLQGPVGIAHVLVEAGNTCLTIRRCTMRDATGGGGVNATLSEALVLEDVFLQSTVSSTLPVLATQCVHGRLQQAWCEAVSSDAFFLSLLGGSDAWWIEGGQSVRTGPGQVEPRAMTLGTAASANHTTLVLNPTILTTGGPPTGASVGHVVLSAPETDTVLLAGTAMGPTTAACFPLVVADSTNAAAHVGTDWRVRMPTVQSGDLASMPNREPGQLAYDRLADLLLVYYASAWHAVASH